MIAGRHAKLHSRTGRRHREIEGVLKLDLLRLREAERARDVSKRLLREHDRCGPHGANRADEVHVFDGLCEQLQAAAILFQKAQARPINLAVDKQAHEPRVTKHRGERQLALSNVERRLRFAQLFVVQPRYVLVGRVAHRGVVSIDVECAHI